MCDYSLYSVRSRPARVGDRLTTRDFGTGTRGFAAQEDPTVAVCVLPGTELAFDQEVKIPGLFFGWKSIGYRTAIFRQVRTDTLLTHHDALEFPDGSRILLTRLCAGQRATVLQLPSIATTDFEKQAQRRVEVVR